MDQLEYMKISVLCGKGTLLKEVIRKYRCAYKQGIAPGLFFDGILPICNANKCSESKQNFHGKTI